MPIDGKEILLCEQKQFTDENDPSQSYDLGFVGEIDSKTKIVKLFPVEVFRHFTTRKR